MNTAEYVAKAKNYLGYNDSTHDQLLTMVTDDVVNGILGYCHIDTIPTQLDTYVPRMVYEMWIRNRFGSDSVANTVSSITQGSRSISYSDISTATTDIINDYAQRLRPYINRRGRVPSDFDEVINDA